MDAEFFEPAVKKRMGWGDGGKISRQRHGIVIMIRLSGGEAQGKRVDLRDAPYLKYL